MGNSNSADGQNENEIRKYRVVLLGDYVSGKTSLIKTFEKRGFDERTAFTIGVDFSMQTVHLDDTKVKFIVFDTAGQDRFSTINNSYYRLVDAAIIVYDITDQESFECAKSWVERLSKISSNTVTALVGNKLDLADKRVVQYEEASQYAKSEGLLFIETSAKTGMNVNDIFFTIYSILIIGSCHIMLENCKEPGQFRWKCNPSLNLPRSKMNETLPILPHDKASTFSPDTVLGSSSNTKNNTEQFVSGIYKKRIYDIMTFHERLSEERLAFLEQQLHTKEVEASKLEEQVVLLKEKLEKENERSKLLEKKSSFEGRKTIIAIATLIIAMILWNLVWENDL